MFQSCNLLPLLLLPFHPSPAPSTLPLLSSYNALHTPPLIVSQPPPHPHSHLLPTPSPFSLSSSPNPIYTPPHILSQPTPHSPSPPLPHLHYNKTHISTSNMADCMLKLKQLHSLCYCTMHVQHTLMSCPNHTRTCDNSSGMRKRGKPFDFMPSCSQPIKGITLQSITYKNECTEISK